MSFFATKLYIPVLPTPNLQNFRDKKALGYGSYRGVVPVLVLAKAK